MKSRINKFPDLKLAKCKDKSSENAIQGISTFEMKAGTTCYIRKLLDSRYLKLQYLLDLKYLI